MSARELAGFADEIESALRCELDRWATDDDVWVRRPELVADWLRPWLNRISVAGS